MALRTAHTTKSGITIPEAYARVGRVELDYFDNTATIFVRIYASAEARAADKEGVERDLRFVVSGAKFTEYFGFAALLSEDPIQRAYTWLRVNAKQFENGVDC